MVRLLGSGGATPLLLGLLQHLAGRGPVAGLPIMLAWRGRVAGGPGCRIKVELGARKAQEKKWWTSTVAGVWQLCRNAARDAGVGWLGRRTAARPGVPAQEAMSRNTYAACLMLRRRMRLLSAPFQISRSVLSCVRA